MMIDQFYLVSVRQTQISVNRGEMIFEIKYMLPDIDQNFDPDQYQEPSLKLIDLMCEKEFYLQIEQFYDENEFENVQDSEIQTFKYGIFEDKNRKPPKALDLIYKQEKLYIGIIDHQTKEQEIYLTVNTMLEIFNQDLNSIDKIQLILLDIMGVEDIHNQILDIQLYVSQPSYNIAIFLKTGQIRIDEFIVNTDSDQIDNNLILTQSSCVNLFQMQSQMTTY